MKSQKWNKRVADKKSAMKIILNQWDEDTRAEIAIGSFFEDNLEAGELIKFLARVRTVCDDTEDADAFFGSWVTKITKHHLQLITIVKELLAAHPTDDAIWDNTNPYDLFLEDINGTETAARIDFTKESIVTTTTSMSIKDDELWFNAHGESDSWCDVPETMDNYQEWDNTPNILGDTSIIDESPKEHIESDFYISECQT